MTYRSDANEAALKELALLLKEDTAAKAIMALRDSGWSMRAIAREFDINFGAVRHCAQRHGIVFKRKRMANS